MMSHHIIDVSHVVEAGVITYPGLPAPVISDFLSREASRPHYDVGTTFYIGQINLVANTGTYLDAPFHRWADGADVAELALDSLAHLEGSVFRAPDGVRSLGRELFGATPLCGKAVLIHTGWDRHWRTPQYFEGHPFLTREAALYLREMGAKLVGIDSLNIDDTSDGARPVHTILLGANIPIVENLCHLHALPDTGFRFYAVPVKVKALGSFPVRAFGLIEQ